MEEHRIGAKGSPTQVKKVRPVIPGKKENLRLENKPAAEMAEELAEAMKKLAII